jgi:hypothetical protein
MTLQPWERAVRVLRRSSDDEEAESRPLSATVGSRAAPSSPDPAGIGAHGLRRCAVSAVHAPDRAAVVLWLQRRQCRRCAGRPLPRRWRRRNRSGSAVSPWGAGVCCYVTGGNCASLQSLTQSAARKGSRASSTGMSTTLSRPRSASSLTPTVKARGCAIVARAKYQFCCRDSALSFAARQEGCARVVGSLTSLSRPHAG